MQEKKVMDLLVRAHNEYVKLEPTHPDDVRDWTNAMHTIQDIVGRRLLRDHFPEIYAKYPKSEDRINIDPSLIIEPGDLKKNMLTARMIPEKGGDIRYTCDRCNGEGIVTCPGCGSVNPYKLKCNGCDGKGYISCGRCNGMGWLEETLKT